MSTFARQFFQRRKYHGSQEPEVTMFRGLRIRLTLWYSAVLAVAFVLFGVALYFAFQNLLFTPVVAGVSTHIQSHVRQLSFSPFDACSSTNYVPGSGPGNQPPDSGQNPLPELVACYDNHGVLLQAQNTSDLPSAFLSNTLAKSALQQHGAVNDIVNAGGQFGSIYRYAQAIILPDGTVLVMEVGASVQTQETALNVLLTLLLTFGGLALLAAGSGGLFLANRSLAPARLAWANQQRFIADAAHELRTPLTLMRADAEVLLRTREQLPEEDAFLLEDIVAEADHMSTLATNMLTLARLDNNATHQEHEVVNLADIASAGARRVQALADQMHISIQVASNGTACVIGDPTLLEQAALILLDNAVKYNYPGGHIVVRTDVQQGKAMLEVSDTGVGIAAEHLSRLGERFYRVDKSRSRQAGGTGLGLSIAHGIAAAHHGALNLTSVPDQGTTATLELPLLNNKPSASLPSEQFQENRL